MSKNGAIDWPSRPVILFLWGYLKSKMYPRNSRLNRELKAERKKNNFSSEIILYGFRCSKKLWNS